MITHSSRSVNTDMIEMLAAIEHERWSHWQKYMHSKCRRQSDGTLVIPANLVIQWERQMSTNYKDLSEKEKESDRDQVQRYLHLIMDAYAQAEFSSSEKG